ncbi:Wzz/FepE/Etk N-terminal domain-containing protein [Aliirhizobium smilacinae]|uniref:non-specific protein-tyrosine kinase n=1 Tax=Aliirhizobium smilacinae TaxID=1395944 RepID=A0A5C4XPV0_9HYPH|nr:Wzz/FepE/Etk N-terminal domain-containing protein [Rhizobium smilacinae]TNM65328.1 hypothetical protein FHP24_03365 [Rhizobium smilacinae]
MNILSQSHFETANGEAESGTGGFRRSLPDFDIIGALRRQMWVLIGAAGIGAILGLGYVMQATPIYSSSASILIDAKNVGMAATTALEGTLAFETGAVDSQLQIMQSDKLAASVAQRLGLQNNFAFLSPPPSLLGGIAQSFRGGISSVVRVISGAPAPTSIEQAPEALRLLVASNKLQGSLKVSRVGRAYVFALEYSDRDPILAQAITGQYVNAYLEDQLDSKFDSTRRATGWMEDRIRELRSRSLAADQAVQKYRADNNLVAASGRLIDEQSLTDATTQLATARLSLDNASARYQRLKEIVDKQDTTASITESAGNPNIAQLRGKYLDAAKLYSDMKARYGDNHSVAIKATKDMAEYERLIFEELKNQLPGYQSDVSIAQSRVNSIQQTITDLRARSVSNDSAMVKLRGLEQESESLKLLYSTFLQKSQEMQQQQSFPVTDSRIISDPSLPIVPSGPQKTAFLIGFIFIGAAFGAGIGGLREWRDRGVRTPAQVRDELGLEFLANIPILDQPRSRELNVASIRRGKDIKFGKPELSATINSDAGVLREVVDRPLSQFSEAIRALKIKIDLGLVGNKGMVVGLASMFPDEGKSTIAKNLASSLAFQGTRTILIDGDLRNPSLTRSLVGSPKRGLIDVINDRAELNEVLVLEEGSGLAFLPGATRAQQGNDLFSNPRTHQFIAKLRQRFDVVIIDFPPVAALTDAFAASGVVDGYVFVAHWGRTPRKSLQEFFDNNPRFSEKTLGLALNKVDMKRLERYGSALGSAHYGKYAEKYFPSK